MEINKRMESILYELVNSNQCLTGQYIAKTLGVTSRTVRNDIKYLNEVLKSKNIHIESIRGKGYILKVENATEIKKLLNVHFKYSIPITPKSRVNYILEQLFVNPKGIFITDINDYLCVSESTLKRDLITVKFFLKEKNLLLNKNKNKSLSIKGAEDDIRHEFFKFMKTLHLFNKKFLSLNEKVEKILFALLNEYSIYLSKDEIDSVVKQVSIVIFRVSYDFSLKEYATICNENSKFSKKFLKELNEICKLNKYDSCVINKIINNAINNTKPNSETIELIKECLLQITEVFGFEYSATLVKSLSLIISKSTNELIRPSYTTNIETEYPLAFEVAMDFYHQICKKMHRDLEEAILIDIIFAFVREMEEKNYEVLQSKKRVVIVSDMHDYQNQFIISQISHYFPAFKIVGVYPFYNIDKVFMINPDLVLTTHFFTHKSIPIILINNIIKAYDILKITTTLKEISTNQKHSFELLNNFREDLFVTNVQAKNKYDAIRCLYEVLKKHYDVSEDFFWSVMEREKVSSTFIDNFVAIPHAIDHNCGDNLIAVGITEKPIDWEGNQVQIVLLVNVKNAKEGNIDKIFSNLYEITKSKEKIKMLMKAKTYYEFIKVIN